MSKLAFKNISGDLFQLTEQMIERGLKESRNSDRKRIILPIHREQYARVQRMINFLQPETYIRPHKHPLVHASETLVLVQGSIQLYIFEVDGSVRSSHEIHSNPIPGVIDIEPQVWHSFSVLEKDTILFECKKGPYDTDTDKSFADWAPAEGSDDIKEWLRQLN